MTYCVECNKKTTPRMFRQVGARLDNKYLCPTCHKLKNKKADTCTCGRLSSYEIDGKGVCSTCYENTTKCMICGAMPEIVDSRGYFCQSCYVKQNSDTAATAQKHREEVSELQRKLDDALAVKQRLLTKYYALLDQRTQSGTQSLYELKYIELNGRMTDLVQLLKQNATFLFKHSDITTSKVLKVIDEAYAAAQVRVYEIIEHNLKEVAAIKSDAGESCSLHQSTEPSKELARK